MRNEVRGKKEERAKCLEPTQVITFDPLGPVWEIVKKRYPWASFEEKTVIWRMLGMYGETREWLPYVNLVGEVKWEFYFKCENCTANCEYRPPFRDDRHVHETIYGLIQRKVITLNIKPTWEYPDKVLADNEFEPEIIPILSDEEVLKEALSVIETKGWIG